jgi:mannitol-specific phosphotransferase system IIBC component
MKQKDISLILVVAVLAVIFSLVLSQTIFVTDKQKKLTAEVVEPIRSDFKEPDKAVFNENAINPTQLIQIGNNSKTNPF